MKYFLSFWFIIGSPFIFPYIAMREGNRHRESKSYFWYGAVSLMMCSIYITLMVLNVMLILR